MRKRDFRGKITKGGNRIPPLKPYIPLAPPILLSAPWWVSEVCISVENRAAIKSNYFPTGYKKLFKYKVDLRAGVRMINVSIRGCYQTTTTGILVKIYLGNHFYG